MLTNFEIRCRELRGLQVMSFHAFCSQALLCPYSANYDSRLDGLTQFNITLSYPISLFTNIISYTNIQDTYYVCCSLTVFYFLALMPTRLKLKSTRFPKMISQSLPIFALKSCELVAMNYQSIWPTYRMSQKFCQICVSTVEELDALLFHS